MLLVLSKYNRDFGLFDMYCQKSWRSESVDILVVLDEQL